ncbi:MAG: LUD domain-containing protein, partial [Planctomycetales bacterium]|nr:LUD domain-containing protein [Planctomycetales bacterium]
LASSAQDIASHVQGLTGFAEAKRVVCTVAGLPLGNIDLAAVADPHELADVDFAILPAEFAVAENGAVWVTDRDLPLRALYFITQHLALVIPHDAVVNNMHEAYERLSFDQPGYGVFISGPSKTADIEQSLVIGAHGARSTTVFMLDA